MNYLFYRDQCSSVLTQRSHQSSSWNVQTSNLTKRMSCLCYQGTFVPFNSYLLVENEILTKVEDDASL